MSSVASGLAGLLPPPLRRSAAGMWLDLVSLPARLADPARRCEPWQSRHNVGGGDFAQVGQDVLGWLQVYAGLTPRSRVLDIGCGVGRVAGPLADYLEPGAGYVGFDVSRHAIALCRRRIGRRRPDFRFEAADVTNGEYRRRGVHREDAYRFPADDGAMDVALATSVFSHMRLPSIRRYLAEAGRVLRLDGRFLFTAYALTPEREARAAVGEGRPVFRPWRGRAWVMDTRAPERAIAHPADDLLQAVAEAGLVSEVFALGAWLGPPDYGGGQDLFVVRKPS